MDAKEEARETRHVEKNFIIVGEGLLTETNHPAVTQEVLSTLKDISDSGVPWKQAVKLLKRSVYPFQHDLHPWVAGRTESPVDCMKSILGTLVYRRKIEQFADQGIDFENHLAMFENDDHQRDDHGHLLKRLANVLRKGDIQDFDYECLQAALEESESGLIYTALVGTHKQSIPDCEKIFSPAVVPSLLRQGYPTEAAFIELISNWHRAADERGLPEAVRVAYNEAMLTWVRDDWAPLSPSNLYLDVNRPIKGIRGLTRELVVGLTASLESKLQRSRTYDILGYEAENPRAFTTDDVEAFFSVLHMIVGVSFTLNELSDQLPKILTE